MDTLGTISLQIAPCAETEHRTEALERLRYLAQSGKYGLLLGSEGTGKSWLFGQLARQLRREGVAVAQLNLSGMAGLELPYQVAGRLGLGVTTSASLLEVWSRLQEYAEAGRSMKRSLAFLVDHIDRADESALVPLGRLMELFNWNCGWLMASRSPCPSVWQSFFQGRSWLKVELKDLQPRETAQLLARDMSERAIAAQFTSEGVTAAHELTAGRIRRLRQLAELASVAVEAEGLKEIDADLLRSLAAELG
ncbi:hypothetical protein [Planctomicrobium piriforme]|uniref:AAA domain-containing protein n=1 Tax=Planctomicrobium piriforme TaxID=1576369 RepID=A0A1I3PB71_9PLAN|nr:hypothetical protein [Planctomicrobium piriforme]SFJ18671.1 hypothetical protein SAMN05421753_11693 [Planctomicrobium piriforme]